MQKILIADDSPDLLDVLSLLLEMHGYKIKAVLTAAELLTTFHSWQPDLILLDVMLGGSDGRKLCRDIKDVGSTVAIVLLSANPEVLENFGDCMADAVIEKPFDINVVIEQIKALL